MVIVAQLVRALVCGAGGRGFEPHQSPYKKRGAKLLFFILYGFVVFLTVVLLAVYQGY